MNYIVCKDKSYFQKIGSYNYCSLEDMDLTDIISVDTETTGLFARKDDMFCAQIGTGKDNYIVVLYNNNYTFSELRPYLENKTMIFHNALFDLGFFYKYNFFPEKILDTMLASKILYNGDVTNRLHDFGSVMNRELGIKYDKTDQKNINIVKLSQRSTIEYSFNDVDKLKELHQVLLEKIKNKGFEDTYSLHCRFIRALAYMEQCGLPINPSLWKRKMEEDIINKMKYEKEIKEYIYDNLPQFRNNQLDLFDDTKEITVSITSSLQMLKVFQAFGINTKDKEGKDSISENVISKTKHEFNTIWLKFQEANHRVTTFGESVYNKIENNLIFTNFNPMVDTSRLSSRKGSINFLNFPSDEKTRYCFTARKGYKMIVCDWSGQETVIAADLSGDKAMTDSVNTGACLHCAFARVLFPELNELDDNTIIKEHKSKRQAAKSPRFAFQYGGNAFTIHINEGIPYNDAVRIEQSFRELHSGLYSWGDVVFKESIKKGYIESADGWKLKLPFFDKFKSLEASINSISKEDWLMYKQGKEEAKLKKENEEYVIVNTKAFTFFTEKKIMVSSYFKLRSEYQRLCLNNPVQSRGAHQLKLSLCLLFEWILKKDLVWKVRIANAVHDEIVLEAEEDYAELAKKALEQSMLKGGDYYLTNLKIKADANIGNSWGQAK